MSAAKGSSNSNKTAHVMNLLRKNEPAAAPPAGSAAPPPEPGAGESIAAAPAPAPVNPQIPPILSSLNADAEISAKIKDALENALEEEPVVETPPPAPEPPVAETSPPAPEPPVVETPPPAPVPPVAETPPPAPEPPAAPPPAPASDDAPALCNIMYELTTERVDKYIEMFDLCRCPRCRDDVTALALNHLTPKYVVMRPSQVSILRDLYANRYNGEIIAQMMQVCKQVKENPRHDS